jgi:hypothetical protein
MKFIDKIQGFVIRILCSEVARVIEYKSKARVKYVCNRMRQNAIYDFVQRAK